METEDIFIEKIGEEYTVNIPSHCVTCNICDIEKCNFIVNDNQEIELEFIRK